MAGLSVLLETQKGTPNYTHVINKTSILKNSSTSSVFSPSSSSGFSSSPFLESCYLCSKKLQEGIDIYMYRGDRAFCSEECRCRQIFVDEESGRRGNCSLAAASGSGKGMERSAGEDGRERAGRRNRWFRALAE